MSNSTPKYCSQGWLSPDDLLKSKEINNDPAPRPEIELTLSKSSWRGYRVLLGNGRSDFHVPYTGLDCKLYMRDLTDPVELPVRITFPYFPFVNHDIACEIESVYIPLDSAFLKMLDRYKRDFEQG